MLIFAKDMSKRDHIHCREDQDPELKKYMETQRGLFPYTIIRAGLDLAYKELDDILNYVDNDHRPPENAPRQEYPADPDVWYRERFPWTGAFLSMEEMHAALVVLIKAMDSFRTWEAPNTCHLMVLYDVVHNIVNFFNDILKTAPDRVRDLRLSRGTEVHFDDFINNYWPNLHFMILSKPDYPHARHMEEKRNIEMEIQKRMGEGEEPATALENIAETFALDPSVVPLLNRDRLDERVWELTTVPLGENPYERLYTERVEDTRYGSIPLIDAEYLRNFDYFKKSPSPSSAVY